MAFLSPHGLFVSLMAFLSPFCLPVAFCLLNGLFVSLIDFLSPRGLFVSLLSSCGLLSS